MGKPKYIDPFTDTGFKIIFGKENQSEEILKEFLNVLFASQPNFNSIEKLTYINSERVRERTGGKTIIHDVICTTSTGHRFIVEMQKALKDDFIFRSMYYLCRGVTDQVKIYSKAEKKPYEFLPVVGVYICDFKIKGVDERICNFYMFSNTETGSILTSSLRCAYIQLPYFNKAWNECETKFDQWVFLLKNMYKLSEFPEQTRKDMVFARLEEVASYSALTEEEKVEYEADLRWANEYEEEIRSAKRAAAEEGREEGRAQGRAEGIAEGRAEGKAEGRTEEKWEMARNLHKLGINLDTISEASGLSKAELLEKL